MSIESPKIAALHLLDCTAYYLSKDGPLHRHNDATDAVHARSVEILRRRLAELLAADLELDAAYAAIGGIKEGSWRQQPHPVAARIRTARERRRRALEAMTRGAL